MADEYQVDLGYLKIAGKFWGDEDGEPTLAVHGYLDNANSFDMIAPSLEGLRIFALDLPGHGWSDHRSGGDTYEGLGYLRDVLAVADHLGWDRFSYLGHSMGGEIGSQLAGLFPERINRLVCIDGYCGTASPPRALELMRRTVASSFKAASSLKVFPTLDAMAQRLQEVTRQNEASARCLLERGHRPVEGGFVWRTDPRIIGTGALEFTRAQLDLLLDQTTAPTLIIVASHEDRWFQRAIDAIMDRKDAHRKVVHVPGHHHLHMQEQAAQVVELINDFMKE